MREAHEQDCRQAFAATREPDRSVTKIGGVTVCDLDPEAWHAYEAAYLEFREHWFASREGAKP